MNVKNNTGIQQSMRRMLAGAQKLQSQQIRRIASGYRINNAADDASGLAIGKKINAQITGLSVASQNAQDAISYLQTAEGAMEQVNSITNRMSELATRASNGILSSTERQMIQAEYDQLAGEIDRIGQSTDFNSLKPFDGGTQSMQVGAEAGEQVDVTIGELSSASLGLDQVDLTTADGARNASGAIQSAIESLSSQRAQIGATENGLTHTINALDNTNENLQAGMSRIMDADIAKESTNRSISMALNATSLAMMKNAQHMMQYNAVSMLMK